LISVTLSQVSLIFNLFNSCNRLVDAEFPDEYHQLNERDLDFRESVVVSQILEEIVSANFITSARVEKPAPIVILQDSEHKSTDEDEPKKFLEKKQKYGRDAKKLYATYQEEW
jgi:hypothetical protein